MIDNLIFRNIQIIFYFRIALRRAYIVSVTQPVTMELWGMQSTPSLPSFPGPLWLGVVAPDRVLFMGQIELNYVPMLNGIVWNRTVLTFKLNADAKLNCFYI